MSESTNQILKLTKSLSSLPEQLTRNAIVPCLDEKSLYALTWTCRHYRSQYKDKHADKKVAAEMLHCVLNPTKPNQARFLELLSVPKKDLNGPPLYLIRNHGEEVYFNKAKVKKTKTKRWGTNVLEAILRTRNFHLANPLFNSIPKEAKTDALKQLIKNIKAQGMWGMPKLQAECKNFIEPWQALYDAENWGELNRLSGLIGQAQKEHLPWFSLYLFCHPVTHSYANYRLPPNWVCILLDNTELDLDLFGHGSIYALYKGAGRYRAWRGACGGGGVACGASVCRLDSAAFTSQCEVLSSELDKTIKMFGLDEPESDMALKPGL
jgi:hypothetical protein